MIVVVATLVGIVTAPLSGGRLRRLARLQLHHIWLIWLTIVVQTLIFELPATIVSESVYELVHLATYATSFLFLWLNRHIPGALIIGVGAACNAAAIFANGGVMPASPSAWARAGLAIVPDAQFENSNIVEQAHLAFLGDIFAIPAGWPLANVFSIGDVVIVLGATYFAHTWCRRAAGDEIAAPAEQERPTKELPTGHGLIETPRHVGFWTDTEIDQVVMDEAQAWLDRQLEELTPAYRG